MKKYLTKENLKKAGMELLQYLILFVAFTLIGKLSELIPDFWLSGNISWISISNYSIHFFLLIFAALLAIAIKPTPITAIYFGYLLFNRLGSVDHIFFLGLVPLVYFIAKKNFLKSVKSWIIAIIIGLVFLVPDIFVGIAQYEIPINFCEAFEYLLAFIVVCIFITHKPKFIERFFNTSSEAKESRLISLSTRILMVFTAAVVLIFGVVLKTMDSAVKYVDDARVVDDGLDIYQDINDYFRENGLSQASLKGWLDMKITGYDGIWGRDPKSETWSYVYNDNAEGQVDYNYIRTVFSDDYTIAVCEAGEMDFSENLVVDGHHIRVLRFHVPEDEVENLEYDEYAYDDTVYTYDETAYEYDESEYDDEYYDDWGYDDDSLYEIYLIANLEGNIEHEKGILWKSIVNFFAVFCIGLPVFFWIIELMITRPINLMIGLISKYAFEDEENREVLEKEFSELKINSGDEIENLYRSFGKTILDMNNYVDKLNLKNEQINQMQVSIIMTMANIVENRDSSTGMHIKRTAQYVEIIAKKMQQDDRFKDIITDKYLDNMRIAAPLHDMGKIHVSDVILNKPGKLDDEEYTIMKTHTTEGKKLLQQAMKDFGDFEYLSMAVEMAGSHHERYDGHGYPEGIKGEEIPLCARIMAVADVFDALVSKRSYKEPMPLVKAYSIIEEGRGTQFDPDVVDAFFESRALIESYYNSAD